MGSDPDFCSFKYRDLTDPRRSLPCKRQERPDRQQGWLLQGSVGTPSTISLQHRKTGSDPDFSWRVAHQFRQHIGIDPVTGRHGAEKSGGVRTVCLGAMGRSSASSPWNRCLTLSAKLIAFGCCSCTLWRRISRTSCSIDQPWRAARWRKEALTESSRLGTGIAVHSWPTGETVGFQTMYPLHSVPV